VADTSVIRAAVSAVIPRRRNARSICLEAVLVLERQQPVLELDDRDLDTECVPGGGELHPHRARAEHDRLLRQLVEDQRLVGADDPLAVELGERDLAGNRAGRDHDRRCGDGT
jgi:hypothetical protein